MHVSRNLERCRRIVFAPTFWPFLVWLWQVRRLLLLSSEHLYLV